jgi:DNA polymerase-4
VGFSGLSDVRQESLFPDLELSTLEPEPHHPVETATEAMFAPGQDSPTWRVGDDVAHPDFGHGWVQGAGHGVVTVRFETRASGAGQARTFAADSGEVTSANPIDSLDWPDYVGVLRSAESAPAPNDPNDIGDG